MMICKSQIRLNSICPVRGSKNDDEGKYNSRTKNGIPLIQPLIYIPLIQPSLKFLDFTVKNNNCYDA